MCMKQSTGGCNMEKRKSNFELMRITSMVLIVLCHVLDEGNIINKCLNPNLKIFFNILMMVTRVHVSSFVLLSGYYQSNSKFKFKKVLKMLLETYFYLLFFLFVAIKLKWIEDYNIMTIINCILPSSTSEYWFVNCYIIMYIFSDYINIFINRMTRSEYKKFLIIGFFVFCLLPFLSGLKFLNNTGYTFYYFIYLYMIGAYLKKFPLKGTYHFKRFSKKQYCYILILIFALALFINYLLYFFASSVNGYGNILNDFSNRIMVTKLCYSTPFVLIQSIAYFELFVLLNIKSKIINFISKFVLGVYLFHENPFIRGKLYKILKIDTGYFVSYKKIVVVIVGTIIIFAIGILVEIFRQYLFKYLDYFITKTKILIRRKKQKCN